MAKLSRSASHRVGNRRLATSITFTGDELNALAHYLSAGVLVLQTNHRVIAKVKAALTRLGLSTPKGL